MRGSTEHGARSTDGVRGARRETRVRTSHDPSGPVPITSLANPPSTPASAMLPSLVNTHGHTGTYVDLMDLHTPVPYGATADDLANVFAFLASDESRMINGQLIRVDGGLLSKMPYFEAYRDAMSAV